ncbi:MAG: hypothetical protein ACP5P6_07620 [Candidatus Saccharicenans sp.]
MNSKLNVSPPILLFLLFLFLFPFLLVPMARPLWSLPVITLQTSNLKLVISETGHLTAIINPVTGKTYLPRGLKAPLLQIRTDQQQEWEQPAQASFDRKSGLITLVYPASNIKAKIKITEQKSHLSFRLVELSDKNIVNAVIWGPYPTVINQTIGEVVGVVRDGEYAFGLQALNPKTLGGVLKLEEEGGADNSCGSTAIHQPYGSSLQAYSLNRSKPRRLSVWNGQCPDMPVPPIPNETTLGSAIALFGCPENQVLDHLEAIELAEGLPHPLINGVWSKKSPETGRAYLISDFTEKNIDEMLDFTEQAGLMSLYHEGPFLTWGHFILNPESFPNGRAGLKACAEKAAQRGLRLGVHTLTNFITTNDPYVTPIPDKHLAETGASVLSQNITPADTEIPVESNKYFNNLKPSTLHAARLGNEIIRFREVTLEPPYKLLDCQRGAFGTTPSPHARGEHIGMLLDYPYQTLFPNFELQQEIASNLARFLNETGISHIDFDGHEGCLASGEGEYAMQAFAEAVYRQTNHTLVNGSSRSSHYYWHICHYLNWGEPWYGGFRESQSDYRFENQKFYERNYLPHMLGWFLLTANTTVEDIEWMMARAAGYQAGFALVARYDSLKKNPETPRLLDLIKLWQEAYRNKIFSPEQLARLKDPDNDFHLEKEGSVWKLYPFKKFKFEHSKKILQSGQPTYSEWHLENTESDQPLCFALMLNGKEGTVKDPWLELDSYFKLELPGTFEAGSSIVSDGQTIKVYNSKGNFLKTLPLSRPIPQFKKGPHLIRFDCQFPEESNLTARLVIKIKGLPEIRP